MLAKQRSENKKKAEASIQKISGALTTLGVLMGKERFDIIPDMVRTPVTVAYAALKEVYDSAKAVMTNEGDGELQEEDMKVANQISPFPLDM